MCDAAGEVRTAVGVVELRTEDGHEQHRYAWRHHEREQQEERVAELEAQVAAEQRHQLPERSGLLTHGPGSGRRLVERGGAAADKTRGEGRMSEPEEIIQVLERALKRKRD